MTIYLHRHAGTVARLIPLNVIFNNLEVCSLNANETKNISLPNENGRIRVEMSSGLELIYPPNDPRIKQFAVSSNEIQLSIEDNEKKFECGTSWLALIDLVTGVSWEYLFPPLKKHVFYLRESTA